MEFHRFKDQRLDGDYDDHYTYMVEQGRSSINGYFSLKIVPTELCFYTNLTIFNKSLEFWVVLKQFPFRPFIGIGGYDINEVINATSKNKYAGYGEWELCFPSRESIREMENNEIRADIEAASRDKGE